MNRLIQQYVSYPLQGLLAHGFFLAVRLFPLNAASSFGGRLGRWIGPKMAITRRAQKNLARVFPDKTPEQVAAIIADMWENLGRVLFEYPLLHRFNVERDVEVIGGEVLDQLRDDGKPGILYSGHFANWEVVPMVPETHDLLTYYFYRAPNNPYVASLFRRQHLTTSSELMPKGQKGARAGLKLLKRGCHLGMLIDQKMNDGIAVPFFGEDAMTAPALAQFGLKYDCPLVGVQIERLHGTKFRVTFSAPLKIEKTDDHHGDINRIMTAVNEQVESWILDQPGQWLWLHNRWPK